VWGQACFLRWYSCDSVPLNLKYTIPKLLSNNYFTQPHDQDHKSLYSSLSLLWKLYKNDEESPTLCTRTHPPSSAPSFTWLYTIQECENQKLVLRNRFHSSKAQLNNLILLSNSYFILSHDHVTKFYTPCYLCCRNHINGLESLFQNMQNMHLWLYFQRRNLAKLIWI
jgi:hypothetical protein